MRGFCCAIHSFAGAVVGLDFGAFTGDKRAVQECSRDAGFLCGCFGCAEFSEGGIEFRGVHGVCICFERQNNTRINGLVNYILR